MKNLVYSIKNKNVVISVRPKFANNKSFPEMFYFVWDNEITIKNVSDKKLSLSPFRWSVVDVLGRETIVELDNSSDESSIEVDPHSDYKYIRTTSLSTPAGIVHGWIDLQNEEGDIIKVRTPTVALDSPFYNFAKN